MRSEIEMPTIEEMIALVVDDVGYKGEKPTFDEVRQVGIPAIEREYMASPHKSEALLKSIHIKVFGSDAVGEAERRFSALTGEKERLQGSAITTRGTTDDGSQVVFSQGWCWFRPHPPNEKGLIQLVFMPLETAHEAWVENGDHSMPWPLQPLVKTWCEQPRTIEPDRRMNKILPLSIARMDLIGHYANDGKRLATGPQGGVAQLPSLGHGHHSMITELPLKPTSSSHTGRVQFAAQVLCMTSVMLFGHGNRIDDATVILNTTLRDFANALFPKRVYRKQVPFIRAALEQMGLLRMLVPELRRYWLLAAVDDLPSDDAEWDDPFPVRVRLPPGRQEGPMLNTAHLPQLRTSSAPAWRAFLRLAYLWDEAKRKNGGHRVYATRPKVMRDSRGNIIDARGAVVMEKGKPTTRWSHPKAVFLGREERNPRADFVPSLTNGDIVRLTFDDSKVDQKTRRARVRIGKEALTLLEDEGLVVIERSKRGWRVLEPRPADDSPTPEDVIVGRT